MHFRKLAQPKQIGTANTYSSKFQRIAVMVTNVLAHQLVMLFIEGLAEPLHGWVKAFKPETL